MEGGAEGEGDVFGCVVVVDFVGGGGLVTVGRVGEVVG